MLCAHLGYQFTESPFLERFGKAASVGFRYVEFPNPYGYESSEIRRQLDENELELVQFATAIGIEGEKGLAAFPGREKEYMKGLALGLRYAQELGCNLIHPMAGIITPEMTFETSWKTYVDNIRRAIEFYEPFGMKVVIEVMSSKVVPGYFMNSYDRFHELLTELGSDACGLIFDTYHAFHDSEDILLSLERNVPHIAHIQISDHPGRHEPGTGTLPFEKFFEKLAALGYQGKIGCEYHPAESTINGLQELNKRYSNFIRY